MRRLLAVDDGSFNEASETSGPASCNHPKVAHQSLNTRSCRFVRAGGLKGMACSLNFKVSRKRTASPKDKKQEGKPEEAQPEGMGAMKMSLEDAVRFLETLKFNEQAMPFKPPARTNRQDRVFKDW